MNVFGVDECFSRRMRDSKKFAGCIVDSLAIVMPRQVLLIHLIRGFIIHWKLNVFR